MQGRPTVPVYLGRKTVHAKTRSVLGKLGRAPRPTLHIVGAGGRQLRSQTLGPTVP